MDEPLSSALFDFDFERTESISGTDLEVARSEVRARIFEEVLLYRPALASMMHHESSGDAKMGFYGMDQTEDMVVDQNEADTKPYATCRDMYDKFHK